MKILMIIPMLLTTIFYSNNKTTNVILGCANYNLNNSNNSNEDYYKDNTLDENNNNEYTNTIDDSSVSTSGGEITKNTTINYFKKLKYFGNNTHNTCGYVATSMLMYYFDTYYNGNVVDNNLTNVSKSKDYINDESYTILDALNYFSYDESPTNYPEYDTNGVSDEVYLNYAEEGSNESLHLKLINDYYSRYNSFGLTITQIADLINQYLNSRGLSSLFELDLVTGTDEEVRDAIIDYVNAGIPVIAGISSNDPMFNPFQNGSAHAVVYYEYDSFTDTLYSHFGFVPGSTAYANVSDKLYLNLQHLSMIAINYTGNHVHSFNYAIIGDDIEEFRMCFCSENTHNHNGYLEYADKDLNHHIKYCSKCGYTIEEEHIFNPITRKCFMCGRSLQKLI